MNRHLRPSNKYIDKYRSSFLFIPVSLNIVITVKQVQNKSNLAQSDTTEKEKNSGENKNKKKK